MCSACSYLAPQLDHQRLLDAFTSPATKEISGALGTSHFFFQTVCMKCSRGCSFDRPLVSKLPVLLQGSTMETV